MADKTSSTQRAMSQTLPSYEATAERERAKPGGLPNLDLLRAAAISGVFAFHYLSAQFRFPALGWTGVWLFFVLSGFLITRGLLSETDRPLGDYLARFYKRRTLRIFPLYFAYVSAIAAASWILAVPLGPGDPIGWLVVFGENFRNWYWDAGTPFIDHMWSLSTEEQFYLVFPFAIYAIPARFRNVFLLSALVVVAAVRGLVGQGLVDAGYSERDVAKTAMVFPFLQWDAFIAGALLAVNEKRLAAFPCRILGLVAALVCAVSIVAVAELRSALVTGQRSLWEAILLKGLSHEAFQDVWVFALIILCCAALTAFAARIGGAGRRVLPLRFFDHVGKISYGMYILHMPLCGWLLRLTARSDKVSFVLSFIGLYLLTALAATVSYRYWERPFLLMKDRPVAWRLWPRRAVPN
jgi:peptidoglycan/LPS O-acetylase OafA/YrhL